VALDDKTNRFLFNVSRADLNLKDGKFGMRHSLLNKYPNLTLHSTLRDAHLYIFKHWVLGLLANNTKICSIKSDLLPLLMNCQHRSSLIHKEGIDGSHLLYSELLNDYPADIFESARLLTISGQRKQSKVTCSAVVHRGGFTARANNVWKYAEINRYLCKANPNIAASTSSISEKTQIGSDSMVGESSCIGERCSIKRSIIGNHVKIGNNCKITNSILMDHVVIEDG
jgi:translation initiation factor eIF-2B subunit gamma